MITIRTTTDSSRPALVGVEVTVQTDTAVYDLSSADIPAEDQSSAAGGLFGRIAWPIARFRITPTTVIEQQMFVPDDGTDVAVSWQICGGASSVKLVVRPQFSGCPPRGYRDAGFQSESDEKGGRLTWLPNVTGPKMIADTNGRYIDEPARTGSAANEQSLLAPGRFEFQLTTQPSILILSSDVPRSAGQHFIGSFLANLVRPNVVSSEKDLSLTEHLLAA